MAVDKKSSKSRGPELLNDLQDKAANLMREKLGIDGEVADGFARALVDQVRRDWGGQLLYFPKGLSMELSDRDLALYQEWDGTRPHLQELAAREGLSEQWMYKIMKAARASQAATRAR